jgi:hypothetical protein
MIKWSYENIPVELSRSRLIQWLLIPKFYRKEIAAAHNV